MFTRTFTSPARERGIPASRLWCASAKAAVMGQGYSVPAVELRLADSIKSAPISQFAKAAPRHEEGDTSANQELGT